MDYLSELGVDAVWLSPFYPSALKDGGCECNPTTPFVLPARVILLLPRRGGGVGAPGRGRSNQFTVMLIG